jgi:hypothetical protein
VRIESFILMGFCGLHLEGSENTSQSYRALFLFQTAPLSVMVQVAFVTAYRHIHKRMNFSSNVPYSRSFLFHIRLSDFTRYILRVSFNATNNVPYMILANIAHVCSLLIWMYRVFINYAIGYMPVHTWIFLIEIAVYKCCVC